MLRPGVFSSACSADVRRPGGRYRHPSGSFPGQSRFSRAAGADRSPRCKPFRENKLRVVARTNPSTSHSCHLSKPSDRILAGRRPGLGYENRDYNRRPAPVTPYAFYILAPLLVVPTRMILRSGTNRSRLRLADPDGSVSSFSDNLEGGTSERTPNSSNRPITPPPSAKGRPERPRR